MKKKGFRILWTFIVTALLLTACQFFSVLTPAKENAQDPAEGIGQTKVNPADGMVLVYVPAGEFLMGSEDEDAWDDEKPEHLVYLDAYWIYQTEVTNRQYNQCIQAEVCSKTWHENPDDDYPVTSVFRRDGRKYCEWAGGRLPTEAEWEKAARGTDGRNYPWGNEPVTGEHGNFCDVNCDEEWGYPDTTQDDGYSQTAPVGSYPLGASPYGALDMAGNVWEWVADGYDRDYYSTAPYRNPQGPKGGGYAELMRGGSWLNTADALRVTYRFSLEEAVFEEIMFETFGFRCVQDDR
jgi:eukaryotic-like serine/threonine-protein kinase